MINICTLQVQKIIIIALCKCKIIIFVSEKNDINVNNNG